MSRRPTLTEGAERGKRSTEGAWDNLITVRAKGYYLYDVCSRRGREGGIGCVEGVKRQDNFSDVV